MDSRLFFAGAIVSVTLGMAVVAPGPTARVAAQDHGRHAVDVAELFRTRCASCHVAPDPAIDTDRAWLQQVEETA